MRLEGRALAADGLHIGVGAAVGLPEGLQVLTAVETGKQPRVGDAVGDPREEVREADGLAERTGEDGEREIECPARAPEDVSE